MSLNRRVYENLDFRGNVNFLYEQLKVRSATEELTLNTGGLTTDSVANLLPANAIILGVVAQITGVINNITNWAVGDATTANRFITVQTTLALGTVVRGLNQFATAGNEVQTAAAKIRVTCTGTQNTTGKIKLTVIYLEIG